MLRAADVDSGNLEASAEDEIEKLEVLHLGVPCYC